MIFDPKTSRQWDFMPSNFIGMMGTIPVFIPMNFCVRFVNVRPAKVKIPQTRLIFIDFCDMFAAVITWNCNMYMW